MWWRWRWTTFDVIISFAWFLVSKLITFSRFEWAADVWLHLALFVINVQLLVNYFPLTSRSHQPLTNILISKMCSRFIIMKLLAIISKIDSFVIYEIRSFVILFFFFFIFWLWLFFIAFNDAWACLFHLPIRLNICVVFMLWLGKVIWMLLALVYLVPG
jgi:hypothetical protein